MSSLSTNFCRPFAFASTAPSKALCQEPACQRDPSNRVRLQMVLEDRPLIPKEDPEVLQSAVNTVLVPTIHLVQDLWARRILWDLVDSGVRGTHDRGVLSWDLLWAHPVLDLNPQAARNVRSRQTRRVGSLVLQGPATCTKSTDRALNENRYRAKPTRELFTAMALSKMAYCVCMLHQWCCLFV